MNTVILGWRNLKGLEWYGFHPWQQNILLFLYLLLLTSLSSSFLFSLFPSLLPFSSSYAQYLPESSFAEGCLLQGMCDFSRMKPTDTAQSQWAGLPGIAGQNDAGPSQQGMACGSGWWAWTLRSNLTDSISDLKEHFAPPRWVQVLSETASLSPPSLPA